MPKGLPEVPDDIEEVLDAIPPQGDWPTHEQKIEIVRKLHTQFLDQGLNHIIDPVRMRRLQISPGMLANACLRRIEELLQLPEEKE
jgi:hypothetical protein